MKTKLKKKKSNHIQIIQTSSIVSPSVLVITISVIFVLIINLSLWVRNELIFQERKQVEDEIVRWELIVQQIPTYRDGYIKLATLYWKVRDDEKAKIALTKAYQIDPNYEEIKALKTQLGY